MSDVRQGAREDPARERESASAAPPEREAERRAERRADREASNPSSAAGQPASLEHRLRERYGQPLDPGIELDSPSSHSGDEDPAERPASSALRRYQHLGELARGGMGAILRVRDTELRRTLAMKKVLPEPSAYDSQAPGAVGEKKLMRFLEEAQITAQLDHPGIVPVHELGIDEEGRAFFTMPLIKGRDFKEIIQLARDEKEGWNLTRALGVMLRVCEAMAFAHAKKVVHRDLKPANLMVGRFGEAYVMDWGLAKVIGREDRRDLRLKPKDVSSVSIVRTDRKDATESDPDSPLVTMDGDVVGTPAYMAPEQAQGRVEDVGPRSDVFAIGAIFYHLFTGQPAYMKPGVRASPHTILNRVIEGPPEPLRTLAPELPEELVAICDKAMAREAERRYASMLELAEDLRAYLEGRVVRAHQTGAAAEFRKWVRRNRLAAGALAAALALFLGGAVVIVRQRDKRLRDLTSEQQQTLAARTTAEELADKEKAARTQAEDMAVRAREAQASADLAAEAARRQSYSSDLTAAALSLELDRSSEARGLLGRCEPARRGWEWNHLALAADSSLARIELPSDGRALVATPDGGFVVLDRDGEIGSVDSDGEGLRAGPDLLERGDPVSHAAFSRDGHIVALGTFSTQGARGYSIHQLPSGEMLHEFEAPVRTAGAGQSTPVALALSPEGRFLAIGNSENEIETVQPILGALSPRSPPWALPSEEDVALIAISDDGGGSGALLASARDDGTVIVHELESGRILARLGGHEGPVTLLRFAHAGGHEWLASASRDLTIRVWDTAGFTLRRVLFGSPSEITALEIDPLGDRIAAGDSSGNLRVWSIASGAQSATLRGHEGSVEALAFGADGLIASLGRDRSLRLWDPAAAHAIARPELPASSWEDLGKLNAIACSPDGQRLIAGDTRGRLVIWDASTILPLDLTLAHPKYVNAASHAADGRRFALGSEDGTASVWRADGSNERLLKGHSKGVADLAFDPAGSRLATASKDKTAIVWNAETGTRIATLQGDQRALASVAWNETGDRLVTGSTGGTVRVWDAASGAQIAAVEIEHARVQVAAFVPGSSTLLIGDDEGRLSLWDPQAGRIVRQVQTSSRAVLALAFHPDGERFVTGSIDGVIRVWDLESLEPLLELASEEMGLRAGATGNVATAIQALEFTRDGASLYGVCGDRLTVWHSAPPAARRPALLHASRLADRVREDVATRYARLLFADAVATELRADPRLDPDAKREALRLVAVTRDEPGRLHANAFAVLSDPSATPARLENALAAARTCEDLEPRERGHRVLSAYALVRLGRASEALDLLSEGVISSRIMSFLSRRPSAEELAVEALAQVAAGKTASLASTLQDLDGALADFVVARLDEKVSFAEIDDLRGQVEVALGQVRAGESADSGAADRLLAGLAGKLDAIMRSRATGIELEPELICLLAEARKALPGWKLREDIAERLGPAR